MITSKNYSQDSKLGNGVWATYRSKDSCPTTCAMYKECYAKKGPCGIQFAKATQGGVQTDSDMIHSYVLSRPEGDKIRHHVAGDFLFQDKIDTEYVNAVIEAHKVRPDLKGWTYTHAWRRFDFNPSTSVPSLNINASCDSVSDIKASRALGFDTCIVVAKDAPKVSKIEGETIVVCPNQINKAIKCSDCMMCFRKDRKFTIGFRKH